MLGRFLTVDVRCDEPDPLLLLGRFLFLVLAFPELLAVIPLKFGVNFRLLLAFQVFGRGGNEFILIQVNRSDIVRLGLFIDRNDLVAKVLLH